jgi:hypothetical protein
MVLKDLQTRPLQPEGTLKNRDDLLLISRLRVLLISITALLGTVWRVPNPFSAHPVRLDPRCDPEYCPLEHYNLGHYKLEHYNLGHYKLERLDQSVHGQTWRYPF